MRIGVNANICRFAKIHNPYRDLMMWGMSSFEKRENKALTAKQNRLP